MNDAELLALLLIVMAAVSYFVGFKTGVRRERNRYDRAIDQVVKHYRPVPKTSEPIHYKKD